MNNHVIDGFMRSMKSPKAFALHAVGSAPGRNVERLGWRLLSRSFGAFVMIEVPSAAGISALGWRAFPRASTYKAETPIFRGFTGCMRGILELSFPVSLTNI